MSEPVVAWAPDGTQVPLEVTLCPEPLPPGFGVPHVFVVPQAGWYRIGDGSMALLTDEQVREMGFEPS